MRGVDAATTIQRAAWCAEALVNTAIMLDIFTAHGLAIALPLHSVQSGCRPPMRCAIAKDRLLKYA
jgi:hypothetical protein